MNTSRRAKGALPIAVVALVVIAIAFFGIGRVTSQLGAAPLPSPTATRIIPTPTPNLTALHVVAAFANPTYYDTCMAQSCFSFTFQASGPFVIVATASAFDVSAYAFGASATYTLSLYNSAGHLIDQVTQGPFDPSQDKAGADVIPEALAAGTYQVKVSTEPYAFNVDVVVLSSSNS